MYKLQKELCQGFLHGQAFYQQKELYIKENASSFGCRITRGQISKQQQWHGMEKEHGFAAQVFSKPLNPSKIN